MGNRVVKSVNSGVVIVNLKLKLLKIDLIIEIKFQ